MALIFRVRSEARVCRISMAAAALHLLPLLSSRVPPARERFRPAPQARSKRFAGVSVPSLSPQGEALARRPNLPLGVRGGGSVRSSREVP